MSQLEEHSLKFLKKKGYEAIDSTGQFPEYRASVSVRIR